MSSNFEFLMEKFPDIAADGETAEGLLYFPNPVTCMFHISRVFNRVIDMLCEHNGISKSWKLKEILDKLYQLRRPEDGKPLIDRSIKLILNSLKELRDSTSHLGEVTTNDNMIMLSQVHSLCEWFYETYEDRHYQRKGFVMPSREQLNPEKAKHKEQKDFDEFHEGKILNATVQKITSYGIFVSIGEVSGLVYKSELPSEDVKVYRIGEKVTVKVIGIDNENRSIVLSIKQAETGTKNDKEANSKTSQTRPKPAASTHSNKFSIMHPGRPPKGKSAVSDVTVSKKTKQVLFPPLKGQSEQKAARSELKARIISDKEFLEMCEDGNTDKVNNALMNGANVNAKDSKGMTALMFAAEWGTPEMIDILIKAGADVQAKDREGTTVLMHAAEFGRTKAISKLLKAGIDVNAKDSKGMTALMFATSPTSSHEVISILLETGAAVNDKDNNGMTALMFAAEWGTPETVDILLKAGADVQGELPKSKDLGFLLHWRILAQNTLRYLCSGISLHKTLRSLFRRDVSFI